VNKFSSFPGAARAIRELSSEVENTRRAIQTITRTQEILTGTGSPNSVVTVTGPAFYIDATNPSVPILWLKSTAGTSATDWILSPAGSTPADYPVVSALAHRLGSVIPGVEFFPAGGPRVLSTLVDAGIALNQDIGNGDFTWWVQFSVPTSLTGNAGVAALTPNNTFCIPASDNAVALVQQNSDIQLVFGNTTNNTRYPLSLSGRTGQIVDVTITRTGGSLSVYIDGALATVAGTNTGAGALPSATLDTNFAMAGGAHSSGNPNAFSGSVFRHVAFNRVLSNSEVLSLVRFGVDIADQWGSKTKIVSGSTRNGNFETWTTPGTAGSTSGTLPGWFPTGVLTGGNSITQNTTSPISGSSDALLTQVSGLVSLWISGYSLTVGRRYLASWVARRISGSNNLRLNSTVTNTVHKITTLTNGVDVSDSVTFVADSTGVYFTFLGSSASVAQLDSVEITQVGAFFDLSFSDIYGFQAPDRSDNELDGTLIGDPAFTLPGTRSGQARWTCGANGGTQILGQRAIPSGAAIHTVFVENIDVAGTPTFNLGTTSGGTQIINAVTIGAAGTTTQITPSAIFSSSGNLWASWSAAGDVRVTVLYNRI